MIVFFYINNHPCHDTELDCIPRKGELISLYSKVCRVEEIKLVIDGNGTYCECFLNSL